MKYIVRSKISHKSFLIDDEADDFQKELLQVLHTSKNGPFSVEPLLNDLDQEEIWAIYLTKISKN